MIYKLKILKTFIIWALVLWTVLISLFLVWGIIQSYNHATDLAFIEAQSSIKKDLAFRRWLSSHGGVYVPITKKTPPNKYLTNIPNRDITSNYGDKLTLMNPAYALRQMMNDYSKLHGIKSKITSDALLNPDNAPDKWERKALKVILKSKKTFWEISHIDNKEYIRLFEPIFTKKSCLKCHADQGYKVGELRGGISIAIDIAPYDNMVEEHIKLNILNNLIVWLIGMFVILWVYIRGKKYILEKITNYEQNIYSLIEIIEKRDRYTAGHGRRVAKYSKLIAEKMGLDNNEIELLYRASMLHDIGKIAIPDSILLKPEKLNNLEYSLIQEHVKVSYELLSEVDIFKDIAVLVKYHHEHYDGSGYPYGIKGDEISISSHIMSFCDAFDSMTTDRIYKGRKDVAKALNESIKLKGKQFHPIVVDTACEVLKNIELEDISQLPQNKNEEERLSYFFKDPLTGCYNYNYLKFLTINSEIKKYRYIYVLSLHNFHQYNKIKGWSAGNNILKDIGESLIRTNKDTIIIRIHGDDFLIPKKDNIEIDTEINSINNTILKDTNITIKYTKLNIDEFDIDNLESILRSLLTTV
ncbi:MAG: DUF3365 domain-containing protein [Sulfurovum sp.]